MDRPTDLYARLGITPSADLGEFGAWITSLSDRDESPQDELRERQRVAAGLIKGQYRISGGIVRDSRGRQVAECSMNFTKYMKAMLWLPMELLKTVDDVYKARQGAVACDRMLMETSKIKKEAVEKGTTKGTKLRKVSRFFDAYLEEIRETLEGEQDPGILRQHIRVLMGDEEAPESVYRRRRKEKKRARRDQNAAPQATD